ncbi:MAG: flippase [Candidatus Doudnabacteria bacterium]|nr:flippase [Candidatus Doudnabacteria bacterium]
MLHIGRNIFSLIFSRVLAGIILFLIYTRLAEYLGPEVAGQYGLLAAYVTVFNFFIDLGMSQLVIKKISENRSNASKYLGNYFAIQLLLAVFFMLIMDSIVFFADYPQIVKNSLYLASLGLFLSTLSLPFRCVINAFQKLTAIARVNFLNSLINGGIMVLAIVLRQDLFFLAFISVAVGLFDLLVYSFLVHSKFVKFKPEFDKFFWKSLWVATLPFMFLTFFSIYNRIDTLLLPHFRNFVETGYYTAAYKFWDVLAFVPAVIGISLYPFFAERLTLGKKDEVRSVLEIFTRYMIAVGVPMIVGAALLSKKMILSFYGPDFAPAAPALAFLVAAVSILFIYSPANSLVISQQTKAATKITGLNLVFNITANILLLPVFGFVAAAAITVVSELIQTVGYSYLIKTRITQFSFFRHLVKPVIAAAIMAMAILVLKNLNLWIIIAASGLVYTLALLLLRFFHKPDWELFKAAVNFRKPVQADTQQQIT